MLRPSIKILERLKRLGWGSDEDGWRKATRSYLRTEQSKFTLAVFRLDIWSDSPHQEHRDPQETKTHIIERLSEFLKDHPIVHGELRWGRFSVNKKRKDAVDIVCAAFDRDGKLEQIRPYFDARYADGAVITGDRKSHINAAIINTYNDVNGLKDETRPRRLKSILSGWVRAGSRIPSDAQGEVLAYIDRVLNSTFLHFETFHGSVAPNDAERFKYPDLIQRKHPGFGVINICCRLTDDHQEADLWFQVSHIPVDGVPMQEILCDLKSRWKTHGKLEFPPVHDVPDGQHPVVPELCSISSGKSARYHASRFIDFGPMLKIRKEMNERYGPGLKERITIISMLGWGLAHHEALSGRKFLFPVDLPACGGKERTLGFVSIKPSLYFHQGGGDGGFLAYQMEFNRKLHSEHQRISDLYKLFNVLSMSHPVLYSFMRKAMQPMLTEIMGSVVITTIKDADLFIAPSADIIEDGFIAFGNCSIPTTNNRRAGLVSVKASREKTVRLMLAMEEVVADYGKFL